MNSGVATLAKPQAAFGAIPPPNSSRRPAGRRPSTIPGSWQGRIAILTRILALLSFAATGIGTVWAQTDQFFDAGGVQIRYVEKGEGGPVVLVHGFSMDAESEWIKTGVFDALAQRYRVIAIDARGHGKSDKPHDPKLYGREMGQDLIRLLDHLGIAKAHIVGYSMGGHIVAQLLTTDPDRFLTATLGGSSGRRNWTPDDQRRVDIEAKELDEGTQRSQILRLWPKGQPLPDDYEIRRRSAEMLGRNDAKALAAVRRSNPDQVVSEGQMSAVAVPTLGIVGTEDSYLKDFLALKAVMPQLELVTIEGPSHGSAPGRPEFVAALLAFLEMHSSGN